LQVRVLPGALGTINLSFSSDDLPPKPPGTINTVVGDGSDGFSSYHRIQLPDGTEDRYYFQLPKGNEIILKTLFNDPPKTHLGKDISGFTAEDICELYVDYLRRIVSDARKQFAPSSK
jgi:hypothetical protein